GRDGRAGRPAVDAGRRDGGDEPPVEPPVPAVHRPVAVLEIQFHAIDPASPGSGRLAEIGPDRSAVRDGRRRTSLSLQSTSRAANAAVRQHRVAGASQVEFALANRVDEGSPFLRVEAEDRPLSAPRSKWWACRSGTWTAAMVVMMAEWGERGRPARGRRGGRS